MVNLFRLQGQSLGFGDVVQDVDGAIQNVAALQQFNQLTSALNSGQSQHGIQVLFELAGCVGTHTQSQSGLTDGSTIEVCGLEDNGGGVVHDFGILATHDACQANGLVTVSDDQHAGLQVADNAVQSGQSLALFSLADHDLVGTNVTVVESVHGLAVLQHDIVGDVNDVVDGADAVCSQAVTQPLGRGTDLDIGNHSCGVAVAQVLCGNLHIQLLENAASVGAVDNGLVVLHFHAESGGGFTGQADDGVAVGTVVGDFEINNGVVVADDQVDVIADLAILVVQDPDAVSENAGQIVLGQAQLLEGAQHAVGLFTAELALGDVNTAGQPGIVQCCGNQIALVDVLSAGDDLHQLFLAHVHLADEHMVRVGVGNHGNNLGYHNILNFSVHTLPGLDLLAEDGERFNIFLIRNVGQVHEFLIDPFSVEFHVFVPPFRTDSGTVRRCRRSDAGH